MTVLMHFRDRDRERVITMLVVSGKRDGAVSGTGLKKRMMNWYSLMHFLFYYLDPPSLMSNFYSQSSRKWKIFSCRGWLHLQQIDRNFYMKEHLEEEYFCFRIIEVHAEVQAYKKVPLHQAKDKMIQANRASKWYPYQKILQD